MAYTDFFCRSGGSNVNGGALASNAEPGTNAVYTSTNGNWSTVTNQFTPTDGTTPASTVTVGDFASVYLDGATLAVCIARVTVVAAGVNGPITLSTTSRVGTAPVTGATGRTIKVGGAWAGPSGAVGFPLNFSASFNVLTNAAADACRINLKNDQTYTVSSQISISSTAFAVQGYTSSAGDGGKATIDGSTNVIKVIAMSGTGSLIADFIFVSSAASGSIDIASDTGGSTWFRCVFHGARNTGLSLQASGSVAIECEAYANNTSNTAAKGGFSLGLVGAACYRCVSHDNTGSNSAGFVGTLGGGIIANCIADTNGGKGINVTIGANGARAQISACDIYNNGSDGIAIATTTNLMCFHIENCNLIKNTGAGINVTATAANYTGLAFNNGYGAGTQANGSADILGGIISSGAVTYGSNLTPWFDPANGDFRINLAAANWAGRGAFTETATSYAGTVGYPDIGAAQSKTGPGGTFSKEVSYGFA